MKCPFCQQEIESYAQEIVGWRVYKIYNCWDCLESWKSTDFFDVDDYPLL